jgi:hypothetical protein
MTRIVNTPDGLYHNEVTSYKGFQTELFYTIRRDFGKNIETP